MCTPHDYSLEFSKAFADHSERMASLAETAHSEALKAKTVSGKNFWNSLAVKAKRESIYSAEKSFSALSMGGLHSVK